MNIEKEIIEYLSVHGALRTTELIETIRDLHKIGRGYSKETLYRRLKQLIESGKIKRLTDEEVRAFGYPDTDGRAEYIDLAIAVERKKHIDALIEGLANSDIIYQKTAFKDLIRYKEKYRLTPAQLDEIVKLLPHDPEIADYGLQILRMFVSRGITPDDTTTFSKNLHDVLSAFCPNSNPDTKKGNALFLLSANDDHRVIEALKDDIRRIQTRKDSESLVSFYLQAGAAPIIEKNRSELFNFECELRREYGNTLADAVAFIRTAAYDEVEQAFKKGRRERDDNSCASQSSYLNTGKCERNV
jgi:DNA-binding Lrp family transcriptional regulator